MQYKGERKSLPEIARELDVEGIIEGTVMRVGDRVRITAQLIDARTDRHLWNDRFDRDLSDVLLLQADVARAVAEQVRLELTPEERAGLASRSVDPAAYDAYLRGRELVGPWGQVRGWAPSAIEQLERAVDERNVPRRSGAVFRYVLLKRRVVRFGASTGALNRSDGRKQAVRGLQKCPDVGRLNRHCGGEKGDRTWCLSAVFAVACYPSPRPQRKGCALRVARRWFLVSQQLRTEICVSAQRCSRPRAAL